MKLKQKYEKHIHSKKKPNKNNNDSIDEAKCSKSIEAINNNDTYLIESSIKSIQKELEKAIESNNINLADELSDKLSNEQIKLNTIKQQIQKTESNKNRKLFWRFEAKQRWETKSNM